MPRPFSNSLPTDFHNDDQSYINDLLGFVTDSQLFTTLASSVHILDLFTEQVDLYERVLPEDWREWFALHGIDFLVDFLLHTDADEVFRNKHEPFNDAQAHPPESLLHYLQQIRKLALKRDVSTSDGQPEIPRKLAVGMRTKKVHEVGLFARYVRALIAELDDLHDTKISHLVDFGAGQGYLDRFMASEPYNMNVVAVEGRNNNVEVARAMDVMVKLAPKTGIMRNKKEYRAERAAAKKAGRSLSPAYRSTRVKKKSTCYDSGADEAIKDMVQDDAPRINLGVEGKGSVRHVEHHLCNGDLKSIIHNLENPDGSTSTVASYSKCNGGSSRSVVSAAETPENDNLPEGQEVNVLVISLHSCGNLSHHALRSLITNTAVKGVAVIGCCYNLLTEKFGPPSYKSDYLRPSPESTDRSSEVLGDAHGFPMSKTLSTYQSAQGVGISFNITARMMAVQAPTNWTRDEADSSFTRHFFRAVLQRVFVDYGVVDPPVSADEAHNDKRLIAARSPAGGSLQPIIIGSLSKSAYKDFHTYARAAISKVQLSDRLNDDLLARLDSITDADLEDYSTKFGHRKKDVGIMWTLMALSATLVEATIVVDRYLWLKEQKEIERCWVKPVFDYKQSPRNLVVVGMKKRACKA